MFRNGKGDRKEQEQGHIFGKRQDKTRHKTREDKTKQDKTRREETQHDNGPGKTPKGKYQRTNTIFKHETPGKRSKGQIPNLNQTRKTKPQTAKTKKTMAKS
jgi:hypothetical protein